MAQHVSGAGRRCRFGDGGGGLRPARRIPRHRPGRRRAPPLFRRPGAADRRRCPPLTAPQAAHRRPLQSPAAASVLLGFFPPLKFTVSCFFFLIGLPFSSGGCRLRSHHPDCSGVVYDLLGSTEFEKSHKQYGPKPISGNDSASAKYSFFLGGWGGRLIQSWLKSRKAEDRVFFPSK